MSAMAGRSDHLDSAKKVVGSVLGATNLVVRNIRYAQQQCAWHTRLLCFHHRLGAGEIGDVRLQQLLRLRVSGTQNGALLSRRSGQSSRRCQTGSSACLLEEITASVYRFIHVYG